MELAFRKYHGLGNDFLLFDLRDNTAPAELLRERASQLCDRRFGVGADGIFLLFSTATAAARVEIYNADGSRPQMCGNGIRCVARYLYEHGGVRQLVIPIETDAGLRVCEVVLSTEGLPETVVVRMGAPSFAPQSLPFLPPQGNAEDTDEVSVDGIWLTAVSMGNPHAVIFTEEDPNELAKSRGPALEVHTCFPERCNIEFARSAGLGRFVVGVWERGCGITLACGTGACAAAVAAVKTGRAHAENEIEIVLPGGSLWIQVRENFSEVFMRGEAREVFAGTCDVFSLRKPPSLQ